MEKIIEKYDLKRIGTDEVARAGFYHESIYLGESPEAVLIFISIHKRLNPDVTLEQLLEKRYIKSVQSYQLALERWDTIQPMSDKNYEKLLKTFDVKKLAA